MIRPSRWLPALLLLAPILLPAQGLFKRSDPLEITITTGLAKLIRDRDSTERVVHGAELQYKDSAGAAVKVAITLRTRGHFRRQGRNCDFPPLKVEISKESARNTLFQGNRTLKLTTNCRPSSADYEQYILQEYAVYRMYQTLTSWSYRTRLAHVTYQDSTGKAKTVQSWAFFVEDDGDLAQRKETKKLATMGAYFADLEPEHAGTMQLFEYMVGNTDWSLSALHNVTLLKDTANVVRAVPFDFDWTGAVDARYSFPDRSLPIRTVRDRLWRGDCLTAEDLTPTFQRFLSHRAGIDSAYTTVASMTPAVQEKMKKYLSDFWPMLENPKKAATAFKASCRDRN